jgi:hypothetical protein
MNQRRFVAAFVLGAAALACVHGCGSGDDDVQDLAHFFPSPAAAYGVSACDRLDEKLAGRRQVQMFWYDSKVDPAIGTRGLARYYRRHGLELWTPSPPARVERSYALDTDLETLAPLLARAFPGVDLDDDRLQTRDPALYERIMTFVANFIFAPVTEFARRHAAGPGVTHIVFLPQIQRPGGPDILPPGASLAGLALSPTLLDTFTATDLEEGRIWKGVDLPASFTPMIFLDRNILARAALRDPVLVDLIASHEFGHASGLPHRENDVSNLMYPTAMAGRSSCTDRLDDGQLAVMRGALGVGAQSMVAMPSQALRVPPHDRAAVAPPFALPPSHLAAMLRGDRTAMARYLSPLFRNVGDRPAR